MFSWFKSNMQREQVREDRKHLEARARRLLKDYLSADAPRKQRYYEVIAGAAVASEPEISDPTLEDTQRTQAAAEFFRCWNLCAVWSLSRRCANFYSAWQLRLLSSFSQSQVFLSPSRLDRAALELTMGGLGEPAGNVSSYA